MANGYRALISDGVGRYNTKLIGVIMPTLIFMLKTKQVSILYLWVGLKRNNMKSQKITIMSYHQDNSAEK